MNEDAKHLQSEGWTIIWQDPVGGYIAARWQGNRFRIWTSVGGDDFSSLSLDRESANNLSRVIRGDE